MHFIWYLVGYLGGERKCSLLSLNVPSFCFQNMEKMSYGFDSDGDTSNKTSVNSTVFEAVLDCYKILSHTRMEEEERTKLLGKLFVALGDLRKESLKQPTSEGEGLHPDKGNNSETVSQKDYGQFLSRYMENIDEQEKALLLFLHNVISQGALVGNNMNLVLQGLHDSKLVRSSEVVNMLKQAFIHREDQQNKMEINENNAENEASMESLKRQGPEVNNRGIIYSSTVTKEAPVSRKKEVSLTHGFQNTKDSSTAQVGGSTPFCISDTYNKMGVNDSLAKRNLSFSDMHNKKGESCQTFQNFKFKQGDKSLPYVSFSNIVKYGKENLCPQVPRPFEKFEASNYSDFRNSPNKDESSLFRIDPTILEKRMEMCSFSVVGKITLAKGDTPWLLRNLRERIESFWRLNSDWRLISLGKGYYHILLNSKEEWDKVWSHGLISLKPGVLRIQRWSLDFDPTKEKNSNAQVWFRIQNLPWCLWEPSVLAGIARKVGLPIRFDKATLESDYGHFARVLVDVDLSKEFRNSVHVEYGTHVFDVQIVPEYVPSFCRNCNVIGHFSKECKLVRNKDIEPFSATTNNQRKEGKEASTNKVSLEPFSNDKNLSFDASLDCSMDPSFSRAQKMDSAKTMKATHAPQWRQKKVHSNSLYNECKEVGYEKCSKPLKVMEMITDFGAQLESHATTVDCSNGISSQNQFSILYDLDGIEKEQIGDKNHLKYDEFCTSQGTDDKDPNQLLTNVLINDTNEGTSLSNSEEYEDRETGKENNGIQNGDIDKAKGDDQVQNVPLSKGDVDHTLKGIRMWAEQEKRKITQPVEHSGQIGEKEVRESPSPKTPKRWSDIKDDEDEKEAEEANSNFYLPQPTDVLSFERNGELTQIFLRNGEIRFTPISDKSKN